MATFLTVKEAAARKGKSPSSIRRLIYPIIHDDNHPDRMHVQPGVEEARDLRLKGESFPWRVSEELLDRDMPDTPEGDKATAPAGSRTGASAESELLAMLRRELDIKNQQIAQQNELTKSLTERIREGNILIGSLQQQLALTDGREKTRDSGTEKHGSTHPDASTVPSSAPKRKKGFFSFFG